MIGNAGPIGSICTLSELYRVCGLMDCKLRGSWNEKCFDNHCPWRQDWHHLWRVACEMAGLCQGAKDARPVNKEHVRIWRAGRTYKSINQSINPQFNILSYMPHRVEGCCVCVVIVGQKPCISKTFSPPYLYTILSCTTALSPPISWKVMVLASTRQWRHALFLYCNVKTVIPWTNGQPQQLD